MISLKLNSSKRAYFFLISSWMAVVSSHAATTDFQYFGTGIDYWNEPVRKQSTPLPAITPAPKTQTDRFSWEKYLDPKNKEFFKEGDYTPPEPFMEIVRNPTDSNLKMWFAYIDKKNDLSTRLQTRIREFMEKQGATLSDGGREYLKSRMDALPNTAPDAKRYRFRMYFDSHCPHCKRMFGTLAELQAKGFAVEARQVDDGTTSLEGTAIPVQKAIPGEVQEKNIQSVPLLLIGDLAKKTVYRLTGYHSTSDVFRMLASSGGSQ